MEKLLTHENPLFTVKIEVLEENEDPKNHFEIAEDVMTAYLTDSLTRWCAMKVTVSCLELPELEATGYLGCCSYATLEEFIDEETGYFSDMKNEATHELLEKIQTMKKYINKNF
jgi:hypothetical protein